MFGFQSLNFPKRVAYQGAPEKGIIVSGWSTDCTGKLEVRVVALPPPQVGWDEQSVLLSIPSGIGLASLTPADVSRTSGYSSLINQETYYYQTHP